MNSKGCNERFGSYWQARVNVTLVCQTKFSALTKLQTSTLGVQVMSIMQTSPFPLHPPQAAALTGGARVNRRLLQLSSSAPWKQEHLRKLGLAGRHQQNLQVSFAAP